MFTAYEKIAAGDSPRAADACWRRISIFMTMGDREQAVEAAHFFDCSVWSCAKALEQLV